MKNTYISPKLNILCFVPVEGLATEPLNLDLELVNLGMTYKSTRGATESDPTTTEDDDMWMPIG